MAKVEQVGRRIKELRSERGWNQTQLARRSELTFQTISNIEVGRYDPRLSNLRKLARALGVPVEELVKEEQGESKDYISARRERMDPGR